MATTIAGSTAYAQVRRKQRIRVGGTGVAIASFALHYNKSGGSCLNYAGTEGRGWETIECVLYNETVTKTYKTFLATYRPVGGIIRVVLVKEDHGCYAFFCSDPEQNAVAMACSLADCGNRSS